MKKYLTRRNVLVAVLAIIVVVGFVLYLSRGWVRESAAPFLAAVTAGKNLETKAMADYSTIGRPLESMGYEGVRKKTTCSTVYAKGFHTEFICNYSVEGTLKVAKDSELSKELPSKASQVMSTLKQNGWEGTYDDADPSASFHELADAISRGIDYSPDASYIKRSQNDKQMSCALTNITAFQSPGTPTIYSQFNCFKKVTVF